MGTTAMDAVTLKRRLVEWTVANSGHEESRNYLGMSGIAECPRRLGWSLLHGRQAPGVHQHLKFYAGYLWEADIKGRLAALDLYTPGSEREVIAQFDSRFRGHTDGEVEGRLLEIKSTVQDAIDRIREDRRIPERHFFQVQAYMRHGGYTGAFVVYVARDTNEIYVHEVRPIRPVADMIDAKAKAILSAVDAGTLPLCECGRCGNA